MGIDDVLIPIAGILMVMVAFISMFSYLAFAKRADNRRREEEARGRYEFLKKLAEGGGFDVQKYIEFEHAEQYFRRQRRIEGLTLTGLILAGVGIACMPFFYFVTQPKLATLGLLPALLGASLFVGARWMAGKTGPPGAR